MAKRGGIIEDKKLGKLRREALIGVASDLSGVSQPSKRGRKPRVSGATTTAGKAISVRLSPEELEALEVLQDRIGAGSRSDALRSLVRASVGMLEFYPEQAARLGEIKTELHKIGVNINQIAMAANRGRIDIARQEWSAVNDLRQALPKVRTWLNAVVDEQRRRGVRLYRSFAEKELG